MRTGPDLPEHELGRSLRRWRALNGVKQSALAGHFGVSQATVSRWESGTAVPGPHEASQVLDLLAARPRAAADRALLDLVMAARDPMHLICDLTHRLLAVAPPRAREWSVAVESLLGQPLWRFATEGIACGEAGLAERGWFAPVAPDVTVRTERAEFPELTIRAGEIRYTRIPLSDGGFARLVRDGVRTDAA